MKKISIYIMAFVLTISNLFCPLTAHAASSKKSPCITLSQYQCALKIGDKYTIHANTFTGLKPTWRSSDSSVASVNSSGRVTAKKHGTAIITANIRGIEASCKVTVLKTSLVINKKSVTLEAGQRERLYAGASTDTIIKWSSSRPSVATINENGVITAKKAGTAMITVTADSTSVTCRVTVK